MPGAQEAIDYLNKRQIPAIVITNQPGIYKNLFTLKGLYEIDLAIQRQLEPESIDAFIFCPHPAPKEGDYVDQKELCCCRKPKPGMLNLAVKFFGGGMDKTLYFGDFESDVQAAENAGVTPVYIATEHDEYEEMQRLIAEKHTETFRSRQFKTLIDGVRLFE